MIEIKELDELDNLFKVCKQFKVPQFYKTSSEINYLQDAESILNEKLLIFEGESELDYTTRVLRHLIKSANYLDNKGQIWKPNWEDNKEYKYSPWFNYSSGGWSFVVSDGHYGHSDAGVGFYKLKSTSDLFGQKFLNLYSIINNG